MIYYRTACLFCLFLVVGYHDNGATVFLVQFVEQIHDFGSHLGIQVTGRLIGKDDVGVADNGTGNGDTLALTA